MLNNGDGTFAAMEQYAAGPECAGLAVDITLGDVTQPAPGNRLLPDGKLDAYVACTPYVVRLTGDGAGRAGQPGADQPRPAAVPRPRDPRPAHADAAPGRQSGAAARLPAWGGELRPSSCASATSSIPSRTSCATTRRCRGRWPSATSTAACAGVPPDEVLTSEGGAMMGIFGFAPTCPAELVPETHAHPCPGRRASSRPRSETSTTTPTSTWSSASPSTAWPPGWTRSTTSS